MQADGYRYNERSWRFLTAQVNDCGRCTHALDQMEAV